VRMGRAGWPNVSFEVQIGAKLKKKNGKTRVTREALEVRCGGLPVEMGASSLAGARNAGGKLVQAELSIDWISGIQALNFPTPLFASLSQYTNKLKVGVAQIGIFGITVGFVLALLGNSLTKIPVHAFDASHNTASHNTDFGCPSDGNKKPITATA
jgi:hypothetical protein